MPSADPYTDKAETNVSTKEKIDGLKEILAQTKYGMFTTRSSSGDMHSRAMNLLADDNLCFSFLGNNTSVKFGEIKNDNSVNISFLDPSSTNWVSVSGKARTSNSRALVKKLYNPLISAWFGDLGDGVHKGDENDPRMGAIEVTPDEIKYWYTTRTRVGQMAEIVSSAVTGETATPGQLRTITKAEVRSLISGY